MSDAKEVRRTFRTRPEAPLKFKTNFRNTIYDVLKARGYKETEGDDWDIHWADREWMSEVFDHLHLDHWQRVNHFRNGRELCRKDLLAKNLKRMKRNLERLGRHEEAAEYDILPPTYNLPGDYAIFVEEYKRNPGSVWIMKPIGKSQGKGIFLFQRLSQISEWKNDFRWKPDNPQAEPYIVQKYIASPYLVGGKKFDLRIYALVTTFSPLTVYFYRSGFSRFSNVRYTVNPSDLANTYVHLTNVAIQKTCPQYSADHGGKWDLRHLKLFMMTKHGVEATNRLFESIRQVVIRSLLSVQKTVINDKHCFEMYGYDILIDDCLKPWLLEVNASPSLTANTEDDYRMKFGLLSDMLTIVDLENQLTGEELQVGGFDLIYRDVDITPPPQSVYTTYLGCETNRERNLKKLRRTAQQKQEAQTQDSGSANGSANGQGQPGAKTSSRSSLSSRRGTNSSRNMTGNPTTTASSQNPRSDSPNSSQSSGSRGKSARKKRSSAPNDVTVRDKARDEVVSRTERMRKVNTTNEASGLASRRRNKTSLTQDQLQPIPSRSITTPAPGTQSRTRERIRQDRDSVLSPRSSNTNILSPQASNRPKRESLNERQLKRIGGSNSSIQDVRHGHYNSE